MEKNRNEKKGKIARQETINRKKWPLEIRREPPRTRHHCRPLLTTTVAVIQGLQSLLLPLRGIYRWRKKKRRDHLSFYNYFLSSLLRVQLNKYTNKIRLIFDRDLVTCDDFGDCHKKILVLGIYLSTIDQFMAIICKGTPHEDSNSESLILLLMPLERKSDIHENQGVGCDFLAS